MLQRLQQGLRAKGWRVVTPPETQASIVTVACAQAAQLAPRLDPRKIVVTLRGNHARVSPSVYNDMDDVEAFLEAFGAA